MAESCQFSTRQVISFLSKELPEPQNSNLMAHVLGRKLRIRDLILNRCEVEQYLIGRYPDLRRALFPSTFADVSMRERWIDERVRHLGHFLWLSSIPKQPAPAAS